MKKPGELSSQTLMQPTLGAYDGTFNPLDGYIYIPTDSGQIVRVLPSSP